MKRYNTIMKLHFASMFIPFVSSFITPQAGNPRYLNGVPLNMVAEDAQVILITGSSQGLGQAMACAMAKEGQKLVVNYITGCDEAADATVEEIKELGGDAIAIQGDCSDPAQVKDLFKQAIDHYGHVDVLINNAGITRDNLVARMKPRDWELVLSVNLSGVFYCTQEFYKHAMTRKTGRIINMASVVGQIGNPGMSLYSCLLSPGFKSRHSQPLRSSFYILQARLIMLPQKEESSV